MAKRQVILITTRTYEIDVPDELDFKDELQRYIDQTPHPVIVNSYSGRIRVVAKDKSASGFMLEE